MTRIAKSAACIVVAAIFFCASCSAPPTTEVQSPSEAALTGEQPEAIPAAAPPRPVREEAALFFPVYMEMKRTRAKYEPTGGIYAGADISRDTLCLSQIDVFEKIVGVPHAIYKSAAALGEELPRAWLLECIANEKTPFLTISAPNDYSPLQIDLLERTARSAGHLNIPMFVELLPIEKPPKGFSSAEYAAFFAAARRLFDEHAPNAAIVWGVSAEALKAASVSLSDYYPGDENVDWVSLRIIRGIDEAGELQDFSGEFLNFYQDFQKIKPIFVSGFAAASFSGRDSSYHINEAAREVYYFYSDLSSKYPAVKGIIYESFREGEGGGRRDDYSIEYDDYLIQAYQDGIYGRGFSFALEAGNAVNSVSLPILSAFDGALYEGQPLISEKTAVLELGINPGGLKRVVVAGNNYYELPDLKKKKNFAHSYDSDRAVMRVIPY